MGIACGAMGALNKTFPPDVSVFRYWHALSWADRAFQKDSWATSIADSTFNTIIRRAHNSMRPDAWYLNTIVQPNVLALAQTLQVPCILHSHEFEFALSILKPKDVEQMVQYPKLIIAASECAASVFRTLGRHENIEICHEPIVADQIQSDRGRSEAIRQSLGIPTDAFVWIMSGTRDVRKNVLGFVRTAASLSKKDPRAYFMWLGGAETAYSLYAQALAKTLNLEDRILWVAARDNDYYDYLNVANGFVLTSVDDTFPIVMLEAAALGTPFTSFNSGGAKEFFREGMGAVIDSWNVEDLASAMLQVMNGEIPVDREKTRARAREFDISIIGKRWEQILWRHFGN